MDSARTRSNVREARKSSGFPIISLASSTFLPLARRVDYSVALSSFLPLLMR